MLNIKRKLMLGGACAALALGSGFSQADSISPTSFETTLDVGESTTIRKTVVVEAAGPGDALVDIMFVFDLTGSMGGIIASAKAAADSVLTSLAASYDLTSGSGWYSDNAPGQGAPAGTLGGDIHINLNGGNTGVTSGIEDMFVPSCGVAGVVVGCGGDGLEMGYDGIAAAANDADWRAGSNRFILALGDIGFKDGVDNQASTIAALDANNVTLLGLGTGSFSSNMQSIIDGTVNGGSVASSSGDIEAFIVAAIGESFANYTSVTVGDLGGGLPGVGVSAVCVSSDAAGACSGASATGVFDRSVDRTFEFDVTFTGIEAGFYGFDTFGLVDGSIVAREADRITVRGDEVPVPVPGTLVLLGLGLGLSGLRRRAAR